jgi:pilus assembly protein CpaE
MAAKLGQTFADANRATKAGAVIRDLARIIADTGDAQEVIAKPSLLAKIDFKSMMSKAKKKEKAAS